MNVVTRTITAQLGNDTLETKWLKDVSKLNLSKEEINQIAKVALWSKKSMISDKDGSIHHMFFARNTNFNLDGNAFLLPRQLIIKNKFVLVVLKGLQGIKGGLEQKEMKRAWDLLNGEFYIIKQIHTPQEKLLYQWLESESNKNTALEGFPKVAKVQEKTTSKGQTKTRVFEKYYPYDLRDWISSQSGSFRIANLINQLQNPLKTLHSFMYQPQALYATNRTFASGVPGFFFHGDISPNNIVVTPDSKNSKYPNYHLIDFGMSCQYEQIGHTPGWGSPETIRFIKELEDGTATMSTVDFNKKYGQKKDTWALGLLIGSLMRRCFHKKYQEKALPCFSFITRHLIITEQSIDESGLVDLKQKEIDKKIDSIIKKIDPSHIDQIIIWQTVRKWLRVNPDKRPTVGEEFLNLI